jgi:hypothetical protein
MTQQRSSPRCERTPRLIDRIVGDRVTPDDREHATTCDSCGPALLRAARFDNELRQSARGLITEQLPYGVLDPSLSPQLVDRMLPVRRAAPGFASILAAVAILVIATSVAVAPGGLGQGSNPPDSGFQVTAPAFRGTVDIIGDLPARDYSCIGGHALPTTGPSARAGEREGVVCLTRKSIENAKAKIIPVENGDGEVVEVTIEGDLYGTATVASRDQLAAVLSNLAFLAIADPEDATAAGDFLLQAVPRLRTLPSGDDALLVFGSVQLYLQRAPSGGYFIRLQPT